MLPKILILSEQFSSGDAITGLNLFSHWDKNSLYCASRCADYFNDNFNSTYLLGSEEVKFIFPLSALNNLPKSEVNPTKKSDRTRKTDNLLKYMYLKILVPVLWFFNLFDGRVKYKVSEQFLTWLDDISPDYIYTSVGSLDMAKFLIELHKKRPGIKVIYHGYDDWVNPNHLCLTSSYSTKSNALLQSILQNSCIRFVISDKMAEEYSARYNCDFITIPNPSYPCKCRDKSSNCSVVFVGKIGFHNIDAILMMAKALDIVAKNTGMALEFEIYSLVDDNEKNRFKKAYINCKFMGWRSHDEIEQILCSSKILYLPISMSKSTTQFTKYSMSTKMSEYLSSGTVILYYGPSGIAMTELLEKENCAFVVKNDKIEYLVHAIESILSNSQVVKEKTINAKLLFESKFSISSVTTRVGNIILDDYLTIKNF